MTEVTANIGPEEGRPQVFSYRDYRALLKDFYSWRKGRDEGFSFRKFSSEAGLGSPNYLKLVMDGERNLSLSMAPAFARALGLSKDEESFFVLLVRFGNARDSQDKAQLFLLLENHRRAEGTIENLDAYKDYFSHWAYPVLGLLLSIDGIDQDPMRLARMLTPSVPVAEVRRALEVLETLGQIEKQPDGRYKVVHRVLETPLEMRQIWMRQYHGRVLDQARFALESMPSEDRNISTFAVTLPQDKLPEFYEHVHRLRRELFRYALELGEKSGLPHNQVVQLAVQAFPVARTDEPGEASG